MRIYEHRLYQEDIKYVAELDLPWEKLDDRGVLISGATGLIGSFLVDVLMYRNVKLQMNCRVYALSRNRKKAEERFAYASDTPFLEFLEQDINQALKGELSGTVDYVIHLASNTHPAAYSMDPIGTITTNIIGTQNLLEYAYTHGVLRCVFASSNEVYGENRGDTETFSESYCGYIDCNTMRAGYPESKRCGEALAQAYIRQKGMDIVIPRLTRSYGPTLLPTDTKALSQFLHKAVEGEDIVLKSAGTQYYSYLYAPDSVSGLLTVLFEGECGQAYNVADEASDIMLKDLAALIAEYVQRKVVFELPEEAERLGYSTATKARLDSTKLRELGWRAGYDISSGVRRTIDIMKGLKN